jgi:uncharacterized repeat protein (TIGR01451 family)
MVTRTSTIFGLWLVLLAAGFLWVVCLPAPLAAQATPAGFIIENTAQATYEDAGTPRTVRSNSVQVLVDEVLAVAIASRDAGPVTVRSAPAVLSFLLSNVGNGPEQFILEPITSVAGNDFDAALEGVAVDSNANGIYDAGIDELLPAPSTTISIAANGSQTIFLVLTKAAGVADGATSIVNLNARAATGSGLPGTVITGAGEGGGDAVVGSGGASAVATGQLIVSAGLVTLVKWASVEDPFGGTAAVPGAIVTYSIQTQVSGSGEMTGLVVSDAIPPRTTYRSNSLQRDGATLTDAAGDDAGEASAAGISVGLGTLAGGASATISFSVSINE